MHGPYHAIVKLDGDSGEIRLDPADVETGSRIADRFYNSGGGTGLYTGFTRAAVFSTALLLVPGERATVEIVGRVGTEGSTRPCEASSFDGHRYCARCGGTGRETARDVSARIESVRRDERGRVVSSLGSRFNERIFEGV